MRRSDRSAGFILVAVLMIMALMAGLVGAVSLVVRSAMGTVAAEVDDVVGDALLRAGVEIAAYQLITLGEKPADIDRQLVRLDDGTVTLFVLPTGTGADLNASEAPLLEAAYKAAGLRTMRPEAFAARVIDWRDADDENREGASEAEEYRAAGLVHRPANDAFRGVDDLQWVLGVTPRDLERLRPFVTVHNPAGTVNLFDASREVLEALPGFRRPAVDRILRLRVKRTDEVAARLLQVVPDAKALVNASLKADLLVKTRIEARPNRGAPRTVEAILIRDPTGREPFRIAGWTDASARRPR